MPYAKRNINPYISTMSYNQLLGNLKKGNITMADIRQTYSKSRAAANKAIKRISKSEVPFSLIEKPEFPTLKELDKLDVLKALADVNNFRNSKYGTVKGRKEMRDKFIAEINRGRKTPLVTKENYPAWGNFMEWFHANRLNLIYGSKDDIIEDFFADSWEEMNETPRHEWDELFNEYIENYI